MTGYMSGVFVICAVIGIAQLISYKGKNIDGAAIGRFAFAVLLLYTIVTPLGEIIKSNSEISIEDFVFDAQDYGQDYAEVSQAAFADGVRDMISEKFGFDKEDVAVSVSGFDFKKMRAEKIKVVLSGKAALADYRSVEKYINEYGIGECDAEIEIR